MRVIGVHVEIGDDPLPVGQRLRLVPARRASTPLSLRVELLQPGGHGVEALVRDRRAARGAVELARAVVLREPEQPRRRELRLRRDARRVDERAARRGGLHTQASEPVRRRNHDRCVAEQLDARFTAHRGADVDTVAERQRDRRTRGQARGAEQDRLPSLEAAERAERRSDDRQRAGRCLDHDDVGLRTGENRSRSTPAGTTV